MQFAALIVVLVIVIALQNRIFQKYSLENLDYSCSITTEEATEGDEISLVEVVSNKKWLPVPWLKSEITTSKWLDFAGAQSAVTDKTRFVPSFFMVKSYKKVERVWAVKCLKRGEFTIQRISLVSTDLLGNVSLTRPAYSDSELLVLPLGIDLESTFISPKYLSGDVVVRRHLLEDPFFIAGVREYSQRDGMNKIHWGATAKQNEIMVHNNDCTSRQSLTVIMNMQSKQYENSDVVDSDTVENCIRTCAAIFDNSLEEQLPLKFLCNASTNNDRVSVCSNEYWGEEHVLELKRTLARLKLTSTDDFSEYLNDIYDSITASDVVIVTAFICEEIAQFSRLKALQGVRVKIFVLGRVNSSDIAEDCEVFCLQEMLNEDDSVGKLGGHQIET